MPDQPSPLLERKLATILSADVVGYSRLMAENEEETLRIFRGHRQVFDSVVAIHRGRIFNTAGDAVLAEFPSAVEAVRCATEIQTALRTRNEQLPPGRKMTFRIGVNVGDVIVQDGDLLGDGVNIAARLQAAAEPEGICISGSVYDQIRNKLSLSFKSLGERKFKNIPQPVRTFCITETENRDALPAHRISARGILKWVAATLLLMAIAGAYWMYSMQQRAIQMAHREVGPAMERATVRVQTQEELAREGRGAEIARQQTAGMTRPDQTTPLAEPSREPANATAAGSTPEAAPPLVRPGISQANGLFTEQDMQRVKTTAAEHKLLVMPPFKIEQPSRELSPRLRNFVGIWASEIGFGSGAGRHAMLIITNVAPPDRATGFYLWGAAPPQSRYQFPAGADEFEGTIKDDQLTFQGYGRYKLTATVTAQGNLTIVQVRPNGENSYITLKPVWLLSDAEHSAGSETVDVPGPR